MTDYQPWKPMSNPKDIKVIGKFGEELGECVAAVCRCIIQQINESEPVTGKNNKDWLEDEIADVLGNAQLVVEHFNLDVDKISERSLVKRERLREWHNNTLPKKVELKPCDCTNFKDCVDGQCEHNEYCQRERGEL